MTWFGFGRNSATPPPQPEEASANAEAPRLSKEAYAHTTGDSPDSTALIEPVRPDPMPESPPVQAAIPAQPPAVDVGARSATRGTSRLRFVRVEPYSVTRLALVVSVALMIVTTVAAAVFWLVLATTGFWDEINQSVAALLSDDSASFDITNYLGFSRMVGGTLVLSGINVILMTALATVGAHLYNLAAALMGGIEATFTDD